MSLEWIITPLDKKKHHNRAEFDCSKRRVGRGTKPTFLYGMVGCSES